jgi:hypothetical protein
MYIWPTRPTRPHPSIVNKVSKIVFKLRILVAKLDGQFAIILQNGEFPYMSILWACEKHSKADQYKYWITKYGRVPWKWRRGREYLFRLSSVSQVAKLKATCPNSGERGMGHFEKETVLPPGWILVCQPDIDLSILYHGGVKIRVRDKSLETPPSKT